MEYRPQIIASDLDGLQVVSACSTGAKVRVSDIKFLLSNKVFLLSIERTKIETDQEDKYINSILRFDNVLKVKSKNINQNNKDLVIELMAIDYLKNNNDYEIRIPSLLVLTKRLALTKRDSASGSRYGRLRRYFFKVYVN